MALFPWKKSESAEKTGGGAAAGGSGGAGAGTGGSAPGFEFDSGKAKRFFDHAVTMHEASNFGYAMNLWLKGLRFDPADMKGVEGFFNSAGRFFTENPKGEKDDSYRSAWSKEASIQPRAASIRASTSSSCAWFGTA
ncbi:MAG: hypothetical protein K2Q20_07920 [Phycisphaerales bacterium]|nr:hypothetical protein [Phycisphaerales bacterium]